MHIYSKSVHTNACNKQSDVCYLSYFHVHTAINILRCFGYPREHNFGLVLILSPTGCTEGCIYFPQSCRNTHLPHFLDCLLNTTLIPCLLVCFCFWLPKRTQFWACFNTESNRLYRRLRLFPSKLQEYTPPLFSRLSTQYHIDPLLTCLLSLDTSRTSLRLQRSTKFSNRHTAHGLYEYSYNLANSRENWAPPKKKIATGRWGLL